MTSSVSNTNTNTNTNTGPTGSGANISALTSGLKQLQNGGPADLKLSTATRDQYLNIINTFRTALQTQRTQMSNLGPLGSPGSLGSAVQTENNLKLDVTGLAGIQQAVDQYLNYLDQFSTTVTDACNRLIQSG